MKRKQGFTLVELLVVMAIIAILASIVVPNVVRYIARARVTRAVSEVSGMELSLTAIMTDAGRGNLSQLFRRDSAQFLFGGNPDPDFANTWVGWPTTTVDPTAFNPKLFEDAANIYAQVAYDLLRLGRDSLSAGSGAIAPRFMERDLLAKLGTEYMPVGLDPWGQVYRVWPGPWRFSTVNIPDEMRNRGVNRWPIPFRIFSVDTGSGQGGSAFAVQRDPFILSGPGADLVDGGLESLRGVIIDPDIWPTQVSLPAQAAKPAYIWSYGGNARSSQMLYWGQYDRNPWNWFNTEEEEDIAGGDDINNWDSGGSWQRFYQ